MSRLSELIAELCPDGVEYRTLGEVCYYPRKRVNVDDLDTGSYVSVENLAQNFAGLTNNIATTKVGFAAVEFKRGDVLVGNIRPYLKKVWLADINGGTNGDVLVFRISDGWRNRVLSEFLYMQLASDAFINFDMKYAKGTKMPRGDKKAVLRFRIPVPPIEVQHEVVRILDEYTAAHDELVEQLEHEVELRESVYENIRDGILLSGKSDTMQSFKDCCESMNTGPFGSMVHKSDYVSDGCPIVNPADIKGTDVTVGKMVSEEAEQRLSRYKLRANDIVIGRRGDMGRIGIIDETTEGYICGTGCFFVRMNGLAISRYWRHLFSTSYAKAYLEAHAVGSTMKNLNLKILGNMPVPVPTLQEQEEIVALLDKYSLLHDDVMHQIRSDISMLNEQLTLLRNHLLSFPEKVS